MEPVESEITVAPVRIDRSFSRSVPALLKLDLTATNLRVPFIELTTRVASASASMSLATSSTGWFDLAIGSRIPNSS